MKTRKTVAKRFKLTGTGKIKMMHDGKGHILTNKSRKRTRNYRKTGYVSKQYERNIKEMIARIIQIKLIFFSPPSFLLFAAF